MPSTRKYQPLINHLKSAVGDEFTMTIEEVEALVGPMKKYTRTKQFWANTVDYGGRPAWVIQREAGFDTAFQLSPQRVQFKRRKA